MRKNIVKSFAAFLLVLCMMLTNFGGWNLVLAENEEQVEQTEQANETKEEPQVNEEENKEETQVDEEEPQDNADEENVEEENKEEADKTIEEDTDESENDGLEISDEKIPEAVGAGIEAPTITKAFIGTNTISGGKLHRGKINGKNARGTVHVTLKDSGGNEKATVSVTPKSGKTWTVNLPEGVTIAEGDTVTAYQEFDGQNSPVTTANVMDSLAKQNKDKLKMPTGEIWIEQTSSNQVNKDEQAEAVELFNNANTAIAGDIKSVKFSIDGINHAYYEVTYTDGSTSGQVEATNLQIKQVTDYSRGATLGSITIVDNVIKGQLAGEGPFDDIKVQILLKLSDAVKDSYCDGGKCLVDKDTSDPVDATVNGTTGEFSYTIPNPDLKLDQKVGVIVKEPHKFKSCSQTTVKPVIPEKTEVKDPRKLTAKDKKAIDAAIRKAYTAEDGVSKLPNGTGDWDGVPAVIQFGASGNAKIFSGNDVAGTWDPNNGYKFVPETNKDGSYKLNEGAQAKITILAKDLLLNKAPDKPEVKVEGGNVIVTPDKVDTDAKTIAVSFKDKNDKDQKIVATKADDGTWSITEGNDLGATVKNGVVTLTTKKVKSNTTVSATVTDAGGIADEDKDEKTSEAGTIELKASVQTPTVTVDETTGDATVTPKENDPDAKSMDITYTPAGSESEITITAKKADDGKWSIDGKTDFVVSNDGKSFTIKNAKVKANSKVKAITKGETDDIKSELAENTVPDKTAPEAPAVKVQDDGSVKITPKNEDETSLEISYTPEGKESTETITAKKTGDKWTLPNSVTDAKVDESTGVITFDKGKVKSGTDVKAKAKDDGGNTSEESNDTPVEVSFNGNQGKGSMDGKILSKNGKYTLPTNTFTPPNDNLEFSGWMIGSGTALMQAGAEITVDKNTEVKAVWKDIEYKVTFNGNTGIGSMDEKLVKKGNEYELPKNGFTAPENKEFDGWMVGTEKKAVGDKITINGDTEVKAIWKDKAGESDKPGTPDKPEPDKPDKPNYPNYPNNPNKPDKPNKPDTPKTPDKPDTPKTPDKNDPDAPKVEEKPNGDIVITPNDKDDPVKIITEDKDGKPEEVEVKKGEDGKWHVDKPDVLTVDPKTGKISLNKGIKFISAESIIKKERGTHHKYLYGYPDGTVRPEGIITRAEAAALIARLALLDMSDASKPNFKDVPSRWYNTAINAVVKKNLIFADKDGNFRPNEAITRGEFARALFYIDKVNDAVAPFADVKGHEFEKAINQAYGNNRISGYPDGTFKPNAFIKRAEAAKILNHYANRGVDYDGSLGQRKYIAYFTDLYESYWGYYEIMEAANSHEYERPLNTRIETWTKIINK